MSESARVMCCGRRVVRTWRMVWRGECAIAWWRTLDVDAVLKKLSKLKNEECQRKKLWPPPPPRFRCWRVSMTSQPPGNQGTSGLRFVFSLCLGDLSGTTDTKMAFSRIALLLALTHIATCEQPSAPSPIAAPLRELPWVKGGLNFLVQSVLPVQKSYRANCVSSIRPIRTAGTADTYKKLNTQRIGATTSPSPTTSGNERMKTGQMSC